MKKVDILCDAMKTEVESATGVFSIPYDSKKYKDSNKLKCIIGITKLKKDFYHMGLSISTPVISNGFIKFKVEEFYLKPDTIYNYTPITPSYDGGVLNYAKNISITEKTLFVAKCTAVSGAFNSPGVWVSSSLSLNGQPLYKDNYLNGVDGTLQLKAFTTSIFMLSSGAELSGHVAGGNGYGIGMFEFYYFGLVRRVRGVKCTVDVLLLEVFWFVGFKISY